MDSWRWLRFHLIPGLGSRKLERLHAAFGSLEALCSEQPAALAMHSGIDVEILKRLSEVEGTWQATRDRLVNQGVSLVSRWDEGYPPLLKQIHDPPALLYVRGTLPRGALLAVVGARRASDAGRTWTEKLCCELASSGIGIVSGLARGIDSAAHRGALRGGGMTWAVLGSGIDCLYPPENTQLALEMEQSGGILSEYPPGTPPLPGHFPGRNRIISGLARGVLVAEAAENSGSLITADFALEQGREVYAVPGPVYHPHGAGPNRLLKQGAQPVTEAGDILAGFGALPRVESRPRSPLQLDEREQLVWENLGTEPLACEEIAMKCGLTPQELSDILLHLELSGGVQQYPGMRFSRTLTS